MAGRRVPAHPALDFLEESLMDGPVTGLTAGWAAQLRYWAVYGWATDVEELMAREVFVLAGVEWDGPEARAALAEYDGTTIGG